MTSNVMLEKNTIPNHRVIKHIIEVLESITFYDWKIRFNNMASDLWFQFCWDDKDHINGGNFVCKGRKWKLSLHMTDSEIVQSVFLAAKVAMEHEIREAFKFQGRPVMRPHFDVYKLMELCDEKAVSKRSEVNNANSM